MESKILVLYIGVAHVRHIDIDEYVRKITKIVIPETFEGEIISIPIQSVDSRIECINPTYITEPELIKLHTETIKKLQEQLEIQLNILKQNNYG